MLRKMAAKPAKGVVGYRCRYPNYRSTYTISIKPFRHCRNTAHARKLRIDAELVTNAVSASEHHLQILFEVLPASTKSKAPEDGSNLGEQLIARGGLSFCLLLCFIGERRLAPKADLGMDFCTSAPGPGLPRSNHLPPESLAYSHFVRIGFGPVHSYLVHALS
jgi:hypothetical protein